MRTLNQNEIIQIYFNLEKKGQHNCWLAFDFTPEGVEEEVDPNGAKDDEEWQALLREEEPLRNTNRFRLLLPPGGGNLPLRNPRKNKIYNTLKGCIENTTRIFLVVDGDHEASSSEAWGYALQSGVVMEAMTPSQMVQYMLDHPEEDLWVEVYCPPSCYDMQFGEGHKFIKKDDFDEFDDAEIKNWEQNFNINLFPWEDLDDNAWPDVVSGLARARLGSGNIFRNDDIIISEWDSKTGPTDAAASYVAKATYLNFTLPKVTGRIPYQNREDDLPTEKEIAAINAVIETPYGELKRTLNKNWELLIEFPETFPELVGSPVLGYRPCDKKINHTFFWNVGLRALNKVDQRNLWLFIVKE